jgi:hypothetical protein
MPTAAQFRTASSVRTLERIVRGSNGMRVNS